MNQNTTFYIDMKGSSFIKNLISKNMDQFGLFLAIFGYPEYLKFSKWLPNFEIHQNISFYTYFWGYNYLQNLISPN